MAGVGSEQLAVERLCKRQELPRGKRVGEVRHESCLGGSNIAATAAEDGLPKLGLQL